MSASRRSLSIGMSAFLICGAVSVRANLISNGSFESGPTTSGITQLGPGAAGPLPSWTLSNDNKWAWYMSNTGGYGTAEDGTKFINVTSPYLEQGFSVTAGQQYTVSYFEAIRADGGGQPDTLDATITLGAGSFTGQLTQIANNSTTNGALSGWKPFSFSFTPDTTTSATLRFSKVNGDGYTVLDNVSVDAVPEPASLGLLGLGACGLLASRRRRKA